MRGLRIQLKTREKTYYQVWHRRSNSIQLWVRSNTQLFRRHMIANCVIIPKVCGAQLTYSEIADIYRAILRYKVDEIYVKRLTEGQIIITTWLPTWDPLSAVLITRDQCWYLHNRARTHKPTTI